MKFIIVYAALAAIGTTIALTLHEQATEPLIKTLTVVNTALAGNNR